MTGWSPLLTLIVESRLFLKIQVRRVLSFVSLLLLPSLVLRRIGKVRLLWTNPLVNVTSSYVP